MLLYRRNTTHFPVLNYEYYLGRHRGEDDALDVYDLNGKLLSHYPHEVKKVNFETARERSG